MAKTSFAPNPVKIKVIGLGGGGCNAVSRMVMQNIQGVDFVAMNTDAQSLAITEAPVRIQLGDKLVKGLGVGGDHMQGQKAAEESRDQIRELVSGADMVFITAGMGGGSGTGAASVVADLAKQAGALTIAVVTRPFSFEGTHRAEVANEGIASMLNKVVDTLIIIPNDRLLELCDPKTGVDEAFKMADDVLSHGVQAIAQVITVPGMINLDFADVRAVMKDAGPAWMSIGTGTGQNRAVEAAKEALASPLLDVSVAGSKGVLFNIVGSDNLSLIEVNEAAAVIKNAVDPDANIIFGVVHDAEMDKEVRITLIATGFEARNDMPGEDQDDEINNVLKEWKSEDQLDIPSFLRKPFFNQRRLSVPSKTSSPSTHPLLH